MKKMSKEAKIKIEKSRYLHKVYTNIWNEIFGVAKNICFNKLVAPSYD